jgi:hypothetical protein
VCTSFWIFIVGSKICLINTVYATLVVYLFVHADITRRKDTAVTSVRKPSATCQSWTVTGWATRASSSLVPSAQPPSGWTIPFINIKFNYHLKNIAPAILFFLFNLFLFKAQQAHLLQAMFLLKLLLRIRMFLGLPGSGSGAISLRYGSGSGSRSFSQKQKQWKTLIPTFLWLFYDILSLKKI